MVAVRARDVRACAFDSDAHDDSGMGSNPSRTCTLSIGNLPHESVASVALSQPFTSIHIRAYQHHNPTHAS